MEKNWENARNKYWNTMASSTLKLNDLTRTKNDNFVTFEQIMFLKVMRLKKSWLGGGGVRPMWMEISTEIKLK